MPRKGYTWTTEAVARRSHTRRLRALGRRRIAVRGNTRYWEVMTLDGYRYEHRVVMETHLGRKLTTDEHVHHVNGDGLDNRLANLLVITNGEHQRHHGQGVHPIAATAAWKLKPGQWAKRHDACVGCGTTERKHLARGYCSPCWERYIRKPRRK